jgi:3-phenylpropionate/trans-cinnamate dioxygenase ferredoxin subunit
VCSHGEVPLSDGDIDGCTLECYMHGSRFDLRTGLPLELPATMPVPVYPVRLDGESVFVDPDNPITTQEQ